VNEGKIEEETGMGFRIHTFIFGNVKVCCEKQKKYFKFNCSSGKSRNTQVEQIHPASHFFI